MGETAALLLQDAVVRIAGFIPGLGAAKCAPLFHALEDEIDAEAVLLFHFPQKRADEILFAHILIRPIAAVSPACRRTLPPSPDIDWCASTGLLW